MNLPPEIPDNCNYDQLVELRRHCDACSDHLLNAHMIDEHAFDSNRICAFSQWQGNLASQVVVVGQDFADVDSFRRLRGWPGANVATNATPIRLLESTGFEVSPPTPGVSEDKLFFTNAVLCMKGLGRRGMQGFVPSYCFRNAKGFFENDTDRRSAVRGDSRQKCASLREANFFRPGPLPKLRDVVGVLHEMRGLRSKLLPVYHPSATVQRTIRSYETMLKDWSPLAEFAQRAEWRCILKSGSSGFCVDSLCAG